MIIFLSKENTFKGGSCGIEVQFFKQYGQNNVDILGDTRAVSIKWYIDYYPVNWDGELTNESWVYA